MKKFLSIVLALTLISLAGCSTAVKTERHYEKSETKNGESSTYEKNTTTYKDDNKIKIEVESYGDGYINVKVETDSEDLSGAWIGLCPEASSYETAGEANESVVLKESITNKVEEFKFEIKGLRKGEYRIVAVLDSSDEDAKTYTADLFAFQ